MAGLDPAIHVFPERVRSKGVDPRHKAGMTEEDQDAVGVA
jgi:hypothetical protein